MSSCCHPLAAGGAASLDIPLLLLTGLTISLGHCIGMCGPIQAGFCLGQERRGARGWRLLPPLLRYHAGRVTSYVLIGGLFGLIGSATRLAGPTTTLQGALALTAGALMLALSLRLLGVLPTQRWAEPAVVGGWITGRIRGLLSGETAPRQLGLGVANGFLPCGPVLAVALTAAAAADPFVGMLLMLVYGVATIPVLLVLGMASSRIGPRVRSRFNRVGAVFVLLLALQLVLRGLSTLGALPHLKFGEFVVW